MSRLRRPDLKRSERLPTLRPALIGATVLHLLLAAALLAYLWGDGSEAAFSSLDEPINARVSIPSENPTEGTNLVWFSPQSWLAASASLPSSEATIPSVSASDPDPTPLPQGRSITLSRQQTPDTLTTSSSPGLVGATALSSADRDLLRQLDRALQTAFMEIWSPPTAEDLPPSQRAAALDVQLNGQMTLTTSALNQPSGSANFDLSILRAAEIVKQRLPMWISAGLPDGTRFPAALPSPLQDSGYNYRITFTIE
ncbi:MAG: hypothetical protein KDK99_08040 [Verrucomicrobiales bacterium]|nr:hypothetical protein [Verrucomicrobiales bacterium]